MKKIKRVFLSTGYYGNVMIATLIKQIGHTDRYEDYFIQSFNHQDLKKNLEIFKLLDCTFKEIYPRKFKERLERVLAKNCKGIIFDEIYVDPIIGASHCFKNYRHSGTKFFGVEEGAVSYSDTKYTNKTVPIKYLLCPEVLINQSQQQKILPIDGNLFKQNMAKLSVKFHEVYAEKSILFLLAMGLLTEIQINEFKIFADNFTKQGYTIYIKSHPRKTQNVQKDLIINCKNSEQIVYLNEDKLKNLFIAEQLIFLLKPKIIAGFAITTLIVGYYFYNIPTFRLANNLAKTHFQAKEVNKLLSAVPYLSDFLKQDKFNAFDYANNYSFYYMNSFKKLLYKEAFYLPSKVSIYLNFFFNTKGLKAMKNFFYILRYLIVCKTYKH